jgi:hypothetical protein
MVYGGGLRQFHAESEVVYVVGEEWIPRIQCDDSLY